MSQEVVDAASEAQLTFDAIGPVDLKAWQAPYHYIRRIEPPARRDARSRSAMIEPSD